MSGQQRLRARRPKITLTASKRGAPTGPHHIDSRFEQKARIINREFDQKSVNGGDDDGRQAGRRLAPLDRVAHGEKKGGKGGGEVSPPPAKKKTKKKDVPLPPESGGGPLPVEG